MLDEPTNDLDMATLELLEEYVASFDGTILIISHDRAFMDNVVTQTWVFDSDDDQQGVITEYVGGYGDYLQQKARSGSSTDKAHKTKADKPSDKTQSEKAKSAPKKDANLEKSSSSNHQKRKLSYKEQREIESLPDEIQALEDEQTKLGALIADGSLFVSDLALATQYSERLNQIDELLIQKLERWDELESLIS